MAPLLLLLAVAEAADPCATTTDGFVTGPIHAPLRDGALGAPRRVCGRNEFAAAVDARATIDLAHFYGYLPGSLDLDGSAQVGHGFEVFGHLEAVRLDLAIASFSSSVIGLGHSKVGAAWQGNASPNVAIGVHTSMMLPTAYPLYQHNAPMGFDFGFELGAQVHEQVEVHASLIGLTSFGTGGFAQPKGGGDASVGFTWRPVRAFGLAVDLDSGFGMRGPLDHLSPGLALRFGDGKRFGFELGGKVPVLGAQRELVAFGLRGSARF